MLRDKDMKVEDPESSHSPVLVSPKISYTPTLPIVCLNEPMFLFVLKLLYIGFLSLVDKTRDKETRYKCTKKKCTGNLKKEKGSNSKQGVLKKLDRRNKNWTKENVSS